MLGWAGRLTSHCRYLILTICYPTRGRKSNLSRCGIHETFENEYVQHDQNQAYFGKYVLHLLLHLGEKLVFSGPFTLASLYSVEGYIRWIVDRCNARYLPAKSMFKSAWCLVSASRHSTLLISIILKLRSKPVTVKSFFPALIMGHHCSRSG